MDVSLLMEAHAAALGGGSVVVIQQSTQPRTTLNRPVAASRRLDGDEQPVVQALMVPFVMIVLDEFVDDVPASVRQRGSVDPGIIP